MNTSSENYDLCFLHGSLLHNFSLASSPILALWAPFKVPSSALLPVYSPRMMTSSTYTVRLLPTTPVAVSLAMTWQFLDQIPNCILDSFTGYRNISNSYLSINLTFLSFIFILHRSQSSLSSLRLWWDSYSGSCFPTLFHKILAFFLFTVFCLCPISTAPTLVEVSKRMTHSVINSPVTILKLK